MKEAKKGTKQYADKRSVLHQRRSVKKNEKEVKENEVESEERMARKGEWKIGRKNEIVATGLGSRLGHLDNTRKRPL